MPDTLLRRTSGACGIIAPPTGLITTLVVASKSPWFGWTEYDLSVLGASGSLTAAFNLGIVLSGAFTLIFAAGLLKYRLAGRLGRAGAISLIIGSVGLVGLGIFPRPVIVAHNIASLTFYLFTALAILLIGTARLISKNRLSWLLSLGTIAVTVVLWLVPWPWEGAAIPQLLQCLPGSLWIMASGVILLTGDGPADIRREA